MYNEIQNILQEENSRKTIPGDVTASKTEIVVAVVIQLKVLDTMYKKIFQWIQQRLKLKYIIRSYLM